MKKIRLSKSCLGPEEKESVLRILDKEFLGMGEEVGLFEDDLSQYLNLNNQKVICVNTGTAALHLSLAALDIGHGDEVLVPSLTYVASLQAISATGAKPIICDVTEDNGLIDPIDARRRITAATKAIMPVHYASNFDNISAIYDLAKEFNLRVIEDAAHSIGSKHAGNYVGSYGDIICFSFDGIKNITSGEGGAIVTSDPNVIQRVRDSRLLGVVKDTEKRLTGQRSWFFDVTNQGFRYHMSNIMAAIGREQLKKLPIFGEKRRAIVSLYRKELSNIQNIKQFTYPTHGEVIPHIYVVKVENNLRSDLMDFLLTNGIECGIHYQPNHLLSLYRTNYSLPVAEKLFTELLTLPLHADLSENDVLYICNLIAQFMDKRNA